MTLFCRLAVLVSGDNSASRKTDGNSSKENSSSIEEK